MHRTNLNIILLLDYNLYVLVMKKIVASLILFLTSTFSFGQNGGCDGVRYIDDSFQNVTISSNFLVGTNKTIGVKTLDFFLDIFEP